MLKTSWLLPMVTVGLLALAANAGDYVTPLLRTPPKIDGRIEVAEWAGATQFAGFLAGGATAGKLEPRRVSGWVGADESTLYVAIRSQLPDEGNLLAAVSQDSLKAVFDDALEVYVCPTPDAADRVDYQFLQNSLGKGGYNIHKLGAPQEDEAWRGSWTSAHAIHDGVWEFECAIPVASMKTVAAGRKTTDGVWAINLCRDWKPDWGWTSLSGGYANSGLRFVFVREPVPVARAAVDGCPLFPPARVSFTAANPGKETLAAKAFIRIVRNNMPELKAERELTLKPGAAETLTLVLDANDPTTIYDMGLSLRAADGRTLYERAIRWNKAKALPRWIAGKPKAAPLVDFNFAFFPTKKLLRLAVDLNGLPKTAKPAKVTASVRNRLDKTVIKAVDVPFASFADGRADVRIELPDLDGALELAVKAEGEGVPANAETVKPLKRQHFPWEGIPLGRSTKVYPPFLPIKVDGKRLSTVLKTHTLNDFGLLDQIEATSANTRVAKPVLGAPMRYALKAGGAAVPLQAKPARTVRAAENEVVTEGEFGGGPLQAAWRNTWDYDGTVKVELTLKPSATPIDELTLEIPFTADSAPLIHANSDRIRAPIAQKLPEGAGVVWDSTKLACDDYIRNFCPYIYLGSAVRGICFFAENDRNWGWNPTTPSVTVVRNGDEVLLRVHLVNVPTTIERERVITFGLLAAPVKPPLNLAGENPDWWRYRYLRSNYRLLGTDINWFGNHSCGTVYPVGGNLFFWEMLGKGNKVRLSEEEIRATSDFGVKYFEPYGAENVDTWKRHVNANLRNHYNGKMLFYYNRAVCQELPEVDTFKDEWCLSDYREFDEGPGRGEIKIVPTDSYIDFALYWYNLSFDIGNNQGVYWDNFFISPSFNTEMTAAYRRPDGTIVPAAGIWQLRELVKRTFVMENERGMLPITFPHMTSFNPLPMMAFATVQYDWEWKYSEGDVQARHSREYLLLASTGELAGVWPVPLSDQGAKGDDQWEQRTFSAVRLVHELDGTGGWGLGWQKSHKENAEKLAKPVMAMLDRPGLIVYKYWEDRPLPVSSGDADLPALVYSVPGQETVAVVVSYAREDRNATVTLDWKTLGLTAGAAVSDAETGTALTVTGNTVAFPLKKHDVKVLRITAAK